MNNPMKGREPHGGVLERFAQKPVKAPFPWFGGKSTVSGLVWDRLGDVPNYVEPFAGSLAVLLARPHVPRIETVNDLNGYLCNFWRAVQADPEAVADFATWPVSELDLVARHKYLRENAATVERLRYEPEFYDVKMAGWWVWGLSIWIGSRFCECDKEQIPHLGGAGMGVTKKLPHLGGAGMGVDNSALKEWFQDLQSRLVRVRVACGEWDRVLGPSVTFKHGLTGVFLDPPYSTDHCDDVYGTGSVSDAVREWAIANGNNPELRIALCGYEGEHTMPGNWSCVPWKARGGMGSQGQGRGRSNAGRERIWFSPYCVQPGLFDEVPA